MKALYLWHVECAAWWQGLPVCRLKAIFDGPSLKKEISCNVSHLKTETTFATYHSLTTTHLVFTMERKKDKSCFKSPGSDPNLTFVCVYTKKYLCVYYQKIPLCVLPKNTVMFHRCLSQSIEPVTVSRKAHYTLACGALSDSLSSPIWNINAPTVRGTQNAVVTAPLWLESGTLALAFGRFEGSSFSNEIRQFKCKLNKRYKLYSSMFL